MPNRLRCNVSLYADDTCLFTSSENIPEIVTKLDHDLNSLSLWLKKNKLLVNVKKCELMFIGTQQRLKYVQNDLANCHIYIDGNEIKQVKSCKYLGVVIDHNLTWNKHIDLVMNKVVKNMYLLRRLRPYIDKDVALTFFKSLIQCHFDYCSSVWSNASKLLLRKLQVLQNRSLRIVMNVDYRYPSNSLYTVLKLDRLDLRWWKQLACTMFRAVFNFYPPYLCELFCYRELVYRTRSGEKKLQLFRPKTNYGKISLRYRGAKLWNDLNHQDINSILSFKRFLLT